MNRNLYIPVVALVLAASLIGAGRAEAQLMPSSELLLPYFEIELQDPGSTTLFSVANSLDKPVDIEITIHTNWGIKVLTIPERLEAHELQSFDLRNWIIKGKLPGRAMKAPERSHLEAVLSGEPSPQDKLYYSTEVAPGIAAGSVRIKALGTPRPAALWGDYFMVDPMQDAAMGDSLVNLDLFSTCTTGGPLCNRHALRYLQGAGFDDATHVVLWTKRVGKPQKSPDPQPRKIRAQGMVYDDSGKAVDTVAFPILAVEVVSVADLGLTHPSGWVDLTTEQPVFIALHHGSRNHYSIALQTWCLPPKEDPPGDEPGISIRKLTNGEDANTAPGPTIPVGSPVRWDYEVKNTGNVKLTHVTVTDDQGVDVKCPKNTLEPGESMTCAGKGVAEACQYKNIGKAVGKAPDGSEVSAEDPSHYLGGQNAKIDIESAVNGQDADTPAGPEIPVGDAVNWTFVVRNTGDVQLAGIKIADAKVLGIACPKTSLRPDESMTCTASGTAASGQFASVATVTAAPPCGPDVADDDPGHYKGVGPGIDLKKLTNGVDYAQAPGAPVAVGSAVTWQYVVTNTGQVALSNVKVTDDQGVAVSCPKTTLAAGESMTCTGNGTAVACQYTNLGIATGKGGSTTVSDEDRSWYYGQPDARLDLESAVNGNDADDAPGIAVSAGQALQWTHVVKNNGNVALTGITLTDDQGLAVSCPKNSLAAGESMTCTGSGTAAAGQHRHVASASGKTPCGASVSDSDPTHYFYNPPPPPPPGGQGCTPGYWKNHTDSWPAAGYSPGQKVQSVFAKASLYPGLGSDTLLGALSMKGGSTLEGAAGNLLRASVAALLDASHPGVNYPRTPASVLSDVDAALASGNRDAILSLASKLDADNNLGCPLN
ncbi:MAG TPA: hypothetical protein VLQ45_17410 [Thermoanaerobaculia bacterium]|nr:hypothetical protein [Thermoanaerobaculia bacterium]